MSLQTAKKIARRGLMCLAVGSALLSVSTSLVDNSQSTSASEVSRSLTERRFKNPSCPLRVGATNFHTELESKDLATSKCATRISRRTDKLTDECFLGGQLRGHSSPAKTPPPVVIEVYFHILKNKAGEGGVPLKALEKQIVVLNEAFGGPGTSGGPSPFRFRVAGWDIKVKDQWFDMTYSEPNPTPAEREAKKELNKGGKSSLNIYTARVAGTHGWARWPWQLADKVDGIVVKYSTLPGGGTPYYNLGDVVVHEVGHWFGLFHTSEGGCAPPGDCVEDTFAEKTPKTDCQSGIDSCPGQGPDPYWNFMNYTTDSCKYLFTHGQVARMDAIFRKYRS